MSRSPCVDCNGELVKPNPVHSYDFSTEGFVLFHCVDCGLCNDAEEIIPISNVILTRYSNRFIEFILKILCNRGRVFSYQQYKILYNRLKEKNLSNPYDFAELLMAECKDIGIDIEQKYVINNIYPHLNLDSYTSNIYIFN